MRLLRCSSLGEDSVAPLYLKICELERLVTCLPKHPTYKSETGKKITVMDTHIQKEEKREV